jgi:2-amino-4-hydroxy-6-hydroxymethyldihydropteridine diphosphokinase
VKNVYIALGSNLGDRLEHLRAGMKLLEQHPNIQVLATSRIIETEPFGVSSQQNSYLNAAAELETSLSASDLLSTMLEIEKSQGRERHERWGARTLDLDILLYGRQIISGPNLEIPHPRMLERAFVLAPMLDIAPNLEIPGTDFTVRQALEKLNLDGIWATENTFNRR